MAKRNLTGRQLAFLFAIGALRRSGGGGKKGEKLTYHPEKLREYKRMSGKGSASSTYRQKGSTFIGGRDSQTAKGFASRHNHNTNAAKYDPSISKSGLGMKSAHLRKGAAKPDYSETREGRAAAARKILEPFGLASPNMKVRQDAPNRRALIEVRRGIVTRVKQSQAVQNARTQRLSTREGRVAAGNQQAQEFLNSARGREAVRLNNRAADHLERQGMSDPGARDINKMRVRQQKAEKTLAQVLKAQRFTYNGFTGDKKKRFARLKALERRLRETYGL